MPLPQISFPHLLLWCPSVHLLWWHYGPWNPTRACCSVRGSTVGRNTTAGVCSVVITLLKSILEPLWGWTMIGGLPGPQPWLDGIPARAFESKLKGTEFHSPMFTVSPVDFLSQDAWLVPALQWPVSSIHHQVNAWFSTCNPAYRTHNSDLLDQYPMSDGRWVWHRVNGTFHLLFALNVFRHEFIWGRTYPWRKRVYCVNPVVFFKS